MDINQIYVAIETPFGYKLSKINNLINLDKYNLISVNNNEYYLEKIEIYKNLLINEINNYDFSKCKIKEINFNRGLLIKRNLYDLLKYIYNYIKDKNKIIQNSKLDILSSENNTRKFINLSKLGISYLKPDANLCMREIINQCQINKIELKIKLLLINKSLVKLKI